MFPTLLSIGPLRIDTYYAVWGSVLCIMILWTRRRAVSSYGFSFNDATDILLWTMFGVFIGATVGGYFDHWSRYAASPIELLYFWESGLSSGPGFIGGGLAGLYKLRKLSLSADAFAESAAVPCAFMLFAGRWGCFFAGCCYGVPTSSFLGVRFPTTGLTPVLPTQLFESTAALLIGLFLCCLEKKLHRPPEEAARGAVLWPLFMILYGGYRFVFDFWRAGDRILGLRVGQYTGLLAFAVGLAWIAWSRRRIAGSGRSAA